MTRALRVFAVLALVLVAAELSARFVFGLPFVDRLFFHDDDVTWQRRWIARHRGTGEARFDYAFDQYDPTKGWATKPGLRDFPAFRGGATLSTNSRGLRGPTEYSPVRDPTRTRILFLGDSFTFGEEVGDADTYPAQLEALLPRSEALNLGVHGYGHDQMLIRLEEEGLRHRPDIVVLGFLTMDMSRNLLQFRDFAKPRFVESGDGSLRLVGSPVPEPEAVLRWSWSRSRLADLLRIAWFVWERRTGERGARQERVTALLLERIAERVRGIGATPVFIFLPWWNELADPRARAVGEDFLLAFCAAHPGVRCVSARSAFVEAIARGEELRAGGHWSRAGHRVVAAVLLDELRALAGREAGSGGGDRAVRAAHQEPGESDDPFSVDGSR